MPGQVVYLERFPLGLVRIGPGYLAPQQSLSKAVNVDIDELGNVRRCRGIQQSHTLTGWTGSDLVIGMHTWIDPASPPQTKTMVVSYLGGGGPFTIKLWETGALADSYTLTATTGTAPISQATTIDNRLVFSVARYSNGSYSSGGDVKKYDGTNVRNVGIVAPTSAVTVALGTPQTAQEDDFAFPAGGWSGGGAGSAHVAKGHTGSPGDSYNLRFLAGETSHSATKDVTFAKTAFDTDGTDDIGPDDFLVVWIGGAPVVNGLVREVKIELSAVAADYTQDLYTNKTNVFAKFPNRKQADIVNVLTAKLKSDIDVDASLTVERNDIEQQRIGNIYSGRTDTNDSETWMPFFFRRSAFAREGTDISTRDFTDVKAVRITVELHDDGAQRDIYLDDLEWWGGYEVEGFATYAPFDEGAATTPQLGTGGITVQVTYENADGAESNGNTASATIDPVRQPIALSSVPVSTDADVTDRRVYYLRQGIDSVSKFEGAIGDNVATTYSVTGDNDGGNIPTTAAPPPKAAFCSAFKGHLVLGATENNSASLVWGSASPDWEHFPNAEEELDAPISGLVRVGAALAIFTYRSIWLLTGSSDADFALSLAVDGQGCRVPRSIQSVPGGVMFVGHDGVYLFNGSSVQLVTAAVQGLFDDGLVPALDVFGAASVYDVRDRRYILCYNSTFTGTAVTRILVLKLRQDGTWIASEETWNQALRGVGSQPATEDRVTGLTYDAEFGETKIAGIKTGIVHEFADRDDDFLSVVPEWEVQTAEVSGAERHEHKHWQWFWSEHAPASQAVEVSLLPEGREVMGSVSVGAELPLEPTEAVVTDDDPSRARAALDPVVSVSERARFVRLRARGRGELESIRFAVAYEGAPRGQGE